MNVFELEASLKLDRKDFEKGIKDAQGSAKDLTKTFDNIEDAAEDMAETFGDAMSDMSGSFEEAAEIINDEDFAVAHYTFDDLVEGTETVSSSFDEMADNISYSAEDIEGSLGGIEDAEGNTGESVFEMADMFKGGFDDIKGIIDNAGLLGPLAGIATATLGIGKAMVDASKEFEIGADNLSFATGLMGEDLETLTRKTHEAYIESLNLNESWDSYSQAGGLIETYWGLDPNSEQYKAVLKDFENYGQATGSSMFGDVEAMNKVLGAWGYGVSDLGNIMNMFMQATQDGGIEVGDLMDVMNRSAPAFQSFGLSMEDSTNFLVNYKLAGGDVNEVNKVMKTAQQELTAQGLDANGMWGTMIETIQGCDSVTEAMNKQIGNTGLTIGDVFGTGGQSQLVVQKLINMEDGIKDFNYELDKGSEKMDMFVSSNVSWTESWEATQRGVAESGKGFLATLGDFFFGSSALIQRTAGLQVDAINGVLDTSVYTDAEINRAHQIAMMEFSGRSVNSAKEASDSLINEGYRAKDELGNMDMKLGGNITVPTFSVSGIFDAISGAVPTIGVSNKVIRNARGYHEVLSLDRPTIFGVGGDGALMGGDGSGSEIVSGEAHLIDLIDNSVAKSMGNVEALLQQLIAVTAQGQNVYLDGKQIANSVSRTINRQANMRSATK